MPWRAETDRVVFSPPPAGNTRLALFWDAFFERSPTPKMLLSCSGLVLAVNGAWQRLWELSDSYVRDVVLTDYNVLQDASLRRAGVLDVIARSLKGEAGGHHVIHYDPGPDARSGRSRYIEARHTPLGRDHAFTGEVLVTFQDVTAREEATAAVRQKDRQLRAVIDNAPALIFLKGRDHRFILANRAIAQTFGAETVEGRLDSDLIPAEQATAVRAWDDKIIAGGVPQRIEETLSTPDGERHFLTVKFPIYDDAGRISGVGGVSQDITESIAVQRDNARLQVSERAAREANRHKSEFLATVSHEIRTPLAGVIGLAQMLLDGPLQQQQRRHVVSLERAAQMLLHVLNDILDLSRLEAKRFSFESHPFDVGQLLEHTCATLAPTAADKGLALSYEVAEDVDRWVIGDAARLGQVLLNTVAPGWAWRSAERSSRAWGGASASTARSAPARPFGRRCRRPAPSSTPRGRSPSRPRPAKTCRG